MVSTLFKHISQKWESIPKWMWVKIKNSWNHHLVFAHRFTFFSKKIKRSTPGSSTPRHLSPGMGCQWPIPVDWPSTKNVKNAWKEKKTPHDPLKSWKKQYNMSVAGKQWVHPSQGNWRQRCIIWNISMYMIVITISMYNIDKTWNEEPSNSLLRGLPKFP